MAKITLNPITNSYASQAILESWRAALEAAIENTLSLDGTTPNSMNADLDLNSNNLLNINNLSVNTLEIAGQNVVPTTIVPNWESSWVTSKSYVVNDLVRQDGNVYICLEAHTSGTFSSDLSMNKWELFVTSGSAGAGTGDLLAANNLNDLADSDTALTNLGGGAAGISLFKDVSAEDARTGLGLGDLATLATVGTSEIDDDAVTFDKIADAVVVTESEGISSNDNDTTVPTSAAVKDYVDTTTSPKAILAAEYASGTAAPHFNSGSWAALPLNTERHDDIGVSISSNQIVFDNAGTYRIFAHIVAQNSSGGGRQAQLRTYNATQTSVGHYGPGKSSQTAAASFLTVDSVMTISASDAIEVQGRTDGGNLDTFNSRNWGGETGLQVTIEKLS